MNSSENNNRAASQDFQTALGFLEERLRSLEDSEDIIDGLLQGAAEFYGAARASVVEADWDLKIGLLTYEWCAEGVEHQKNMLQYLAVESFPRWCEFLSLNRPVVIPDMEAIRDTYPDEYQFFQRYGVKSILAAPFSKRINQGYIAVDDPTHFQDDPTFLFIISYAVVVELNEIKLSQSIAAAQRASKYSDHDVYVNCLGDLEIRNAKGTLTEEDISSDLCLNLFALIITNMKRALKIERLAEALWPGDVMDNPYRSVSNIAYRLRRILSIIDLEDLVVGRHGTFVINPEYNVYTDFDRFEDNCRRMEAEANPKAQSELYQGAVELYRGDLFSKISYQHWLMPKTAYYHNIFLRIIKCYIERKMEQGDYAQTYAAENAGENVNALIINFIRTGVERYTSGTWEMVCGKENTAFTAYVAEQDAANGTSASALKNIENFALPNGDPADLGHVFGAMDVANYAKVQGMTEAAVQARADMGSWAGDITDLMYCAENVDIPDRVDTSETDVDVLAANIRARYLGVP